MRTADYDRRVARIRAQRAALGRKGRKGWTSRRGADGSTVWTSPEGRVGARPPELLAALARRSEAVQRQTTPIRPKLVEGVRYAMADW